MNAQTCTRCGKCKQACSMYLRKGTALPPAQQEHHPGRAGRGEDIYYSQLQNGEPDPRLLGELRKILSTARPAANANAICSVKIRTQDVTLQMREYLEEKGAGGHRSRTAC